MDAYQGVLGKLDLREFDSKPVPTDVKLKVLEAGRSTATGMNVQHLRFILVDSPQGIRKLAEGSTTGKWVEGANFGVILLTNPKYGFHLLDAGRAVQNMEIAAWNFGLVSCPFTGINREAYERDFKIPRDLNPGAVVGFGYPTRKILGKKNRKPLPDLAFHESYGNDIGSIRRT